jgi:cell division protease FtsH
LSEDNSLLVFDEAAGPLSGDAQARMDASVNALLQRLYGQTREIMLRHRSALEALALALLEHETIDGPDAVRILRENGVV